MNEAAEDDIETKLEDAFIYLLHQDIYPEIKGVYAWADDSKDEPCIGVKATVENAESQREGGDIIAVKVEIKLRHAKNGQRRGLFRCVENGIGKMDELAERIADAAGGSVHVWNDPEMEGGDKQFIDDNKIERTRNLLVRVAHRC